MEGSVAAHFKPLAAARAFGVGRRLTTLRTCGRATAMRGGSAPMRV
jgi:hypothetical protein